MYHEKNTASGYAAQGDKNARSSVMQQLQAIFFSARPHQWSKNTLVFVPFLIVHQFTFVNISKSLFAFAAFCLAASSSYIFNDLRDLHADRLHPTKRERPCASGQLSPAIGYCASGVLLCGAILVALQLPFGFMMSLAAYALGTFSYSLFFKRKLGLDVVLLACLYTIRVIAGDEAIAADLVGVDSSEWMLGFACLFFLSLSLIKRCSEIFELSENEDTATIPGRPYRKEDLPLLFSLACASAIGSLTIFIRYVGSSAVGQHFNEPRFLWMTVPILIYWIIRLLLLSSRGAIRVDPVLFTLRDRSSQACGAAIFALMAVAW